MKKILLGAYKQVSNMAKENDLPLRTAAYMIAVSRLAKAIELRGLFP